MRRGNLHHDRKDGAGNTICGIGLGGLGKANMDMRLAKVETPISISLADQKCSERLASA